MTHDEAFLQAVLEAPDDDTPRLIYADWLEEQNDPRGELIRLQAQLARVGADDPRRPALEERERRLFAEQAPHLSRSPRDQAAAFAFCRRFMRRDTVPAAAYLAHAAVFRAAPLRAFYLDLTGFQVPVKVLEYCPESVARENLILPLAAQGGTLTFAMRHPGDENLLQRLQFVFNRDIEPVAARAHQLAAAIERHFPWDSAPQQVITACFFGDTTAWEAGPPPEPDTLAVQKLVDLIIGEALALRASEVHIRPLADCFRVRYRIDGTWRERDRPPHRLLAPVVARLREMAGLFHRIGQCRLRGRAGGRLYDLLLRIRESGDGPHVLLRL
jgi:uncharacterized protein (TIGR02996 family)